MATDKRHWTDDTPLPTLAVAWSVVFGALYVLGRVCRWAARR